MASGPDAPAAADIFTKYLTPTLPLADAELAHHGGDAAATVRAMTDAAVERIFSYGDADRYVSGALVRNIVDRAKTAAIKATVAGESRGLTTAHLQNAADQELAEARAVAAKNLGGA